MWIHREIETALKSAASERPAIIVCGARQAGKTSLLQRAFPDRRYVSLDIPAIAEQAETSGERFLDENPPPLILDEVQYAPALFRYIKADIDQHRDKYGRFLLSGSQKFTVMQGVSESLAGRIGVLELHSLAAREFESWSGEGLKGAKLLDWIFGGGYPELRVRGLNTERFYADYLVTYLERDVRSVLNVKNLRDFDRFMRLCASRTGQLLSMNSFAS
ncbi:MAG: AAA family ATPase, partial [Pseudomonadota bacterium]